MPEFERLLRGEGQVEGDSQLSELGRGRGARGSRSPSALGERAGFLVAGARLLEVADRHQREGELEQDLDAFTMPPVPRSATALA